MYGEWSSSTAGEPFFFTPSWPSRTTSPLFLSTTSCFDTWSSLRLPFPSRITSHSEQHVFHLPGPAGPSLRWWSQVRAVLAHNFHQLLVYFTISWLTKHQTSYFPKVFPLSSWRSKYWSLNTVMFVLIFKSSLARATPAVSGVYQNHRECYQKCQRQIQETSGLLLLPEASGLLPEKLGQLPWASGLLLLWKI